MKIYKQEEKGLVILDCPEREWVYVGYYSDVLKAWEDLQEWGHDMLAWGIDTPYEDLNEFEGPRESWTYIEDLIDE